MASHSYGRYYYAVETPKAYDMAFADRVTVENGCLMLWGAHRNDKDEATGPENLLLCYGPGQWLRCSAASVMTGDFVAIDHVDQKKSK